MGAMLRRILAVVIIWATLAQIFDFFKFGILEEPLPYFIVLSLGFLIMLFSKQSLPGAAPTWNIKAICLSILLIIIGGVQLAKFYDLAYVNTSSTIQLIPDGLINILLLLIATILIFIETRAGNETVNL